MDGPIGVILLKAINGDDGTKDTTTVNVHAIARVLVEQAGLKETGILLGQLMWANVLMEYCLTSTRNNEAPGISHMCCLEHSLLQGKFVQEEGGHLADISLQNQSIFLWH